MEPTDLGNLNPILRRMSSPLLRQTWTTSAVLINMFGQGLVLGYPSSLLLGLKDPDSPIKADLHTASWLGSIIGVPGIPGFLISSLLMEIFGRRITHVLVILPGVVGWLVIYFANDITTLMIGRFLGGFTATATLSLGAMVIGEYTGPKYRGVFLYLKNAAICIGAMFLHIVSQFLHWRTVALISLAPLFVALMITCTWPESPAWLISKQQYEKSEKAFFWLQGKNEASCREISDIIKAQRDRLSKPKLILSYSENTINFFKKFTKKDFLKPLIVMILATIVLEMSGRHVFPAYALHIVAEMIGETSSESFYYTLGIDLTITTSALFASFLVKILKRRTLLFSSGFSAFGVLMLVCIYLFLASREIILADSPLLPVLLLILYFFLANLGCAPIPVSLVGEVFPLAHRGVGLALSGVWIAICLLIGLKSTPHLIDSIQVYGFFAVYGIIMGVSLLILYFMMPETKDRTLQEIENYFNYGKYTNTSNDDDDEEEAKSKMISETDLYLK